MSLSQEHLSGAKHEDDLWAGDPEGRPAVLVRLGLPVGNSSIDGGGKEWNSAYGVVKRGYVGLDGVGESKEKGY